MNGFRLKQTIFNAFPFIALATTRNKWNHMQPLLTGRKRRLSISLFLSAYPNEDAFVIVKMKDSNP